MAVWADRQRGGWQDESQRAKAQTDESKMGRVGFRGPLGVFRARGFSLRLLLLARRLLRSVQVRDLDVEFQVGTGDPEATGPLFGVIGPGVALARSGFSPNINIEPNFVEETFEGHVSGAVRVSVKLVRLSHSPRHQARFER